MPGILDALRQQGYSDVDIQKVIQKMGLANPRDINLPNTQGADTSSPLLNAVRDASLGTSDYGVPAAAVNQANGLGMLGNPSPANPVNQANEDTKDEEAPAEDMQGGGGAASEEKGAGGLASSVASHKPQVQDYSKLLSPEKIQAASDEDARLNRLAALSKAGSLIGNFYGAQPQFGGSEAIKSLATNLPSLQEQGKVAGEAQGLVTQQAAMDPKSIENQVGRSILAKYFPNLAGNIQGFDNLAVLANPTLSKLLATNPDYKNALLAVHQGNLNVKQQQLGLSGERVNLAKEKFAAPEEQAQATMAGKNLVTLSGLRRLTDAYSDDYDKMPNSQVAELATGIARVLGGGIAAQHTIDMIRPKSLQGVWNAAGSFVTNQPLGAGQGKFVENLVHLLDREESNAKSIVQGIGGRRRAAVGLPPAQEAGMEAKIQQAKQAGYSDQEIQEYLKNAQ